MKRFLIISLVALGSVASLCAGTVSYQVVVDSSSIAPSTPGFLEFQFNQANAATSGAALAYVSDFTSAGFTFDDSSDASLGGATGSLSAPPLVFDNTVGGTNLYDEGVSSFGSSFSFVLTLDGDALSTPETDGSQFFVYLLGTDYSTLLGTDAGGVGGVTINGDTTTTPNAVDGISVVSLYTPISSNPSSNPSSSPSSATPEPSTIMLLALSGAMLICLRRSHLKV